MNLPELFIRRPVTTTLVMVGILIFGMAGYSLLPVSELPNVDYPTIQVTANLSGASPETMASSVATPLEKEFSSIAGLDSMTSTSALGVSQITLQFSLERSIDAAAQDVQTAISKAQRVLPPDMTNPPYFRKVNPADAPILFLALRSPILPLSTVDEYAQTLLAQRISMINGVAQVQVHGSQKYAVRVQVNPNILNSLGIGMDEIEKAIAKANVNIPTGTLNGKDQAITVQATGQLFNAEAYRPLIVAYKNGSPVRLGALGRVIDSVENDKVATWYNDSRAIMLAVQRQPGTNTVEVVDAIKQLLPAFREQLPGSVDLSIHYDRSVSIRDSVEDVKFTLYLSVMLVVLVIFLFLRNLSATIIPSLAVPMSIVGTFAAMYFMDFSLNNLSLMALTLCVGFVVDDAIVMLENIVRHMEMGKGRMQAALDGSREIGFTIISMTLSLAAVFIPLLLMRGLLGRLLHEFAVTIGVAVLVSGFVSLSLSPMLCSRFLKPPGEIRHGRVYAFFERFFDGMLHVYDCCLKVVMRYRAVTLIFSFVLVGVTAYLFIIIPKDFIPSQDTGQINGFTEAAQGTSFDSMVQHQQVLASIVSKDPAVASYMSSVGATGSSPTGNSGRLVLRLKPRDERTDTVEQIIQRLRPKLAAVPGISAFLQNPPAIRIGGMMSKSLYQFTVQGPDVKELYQYAPQIEARVRDLPALQDVTSDLQITNPQVMVEIDRDKAHSYGISAEQIENTLYSAFGSRQVSTIYSSTNQYDVILEVEPRYQMSPADLSALYVNSDKGRLVPISSIARINRKAGPLTVNHVMQLPSVTVSFNIRPGAALGDAVSQIQSAVRDMRLPATLTTSFQGSAQQFQASMKGMWILLAMAILVIYIVLGILYESFIHPLTILSGLPSAGVGALLTLKLFDVVLSIYAFVGIIMLVGIGKTTAIMMSDFALHVQRQEGKSPAEAIYQGCIMRFRPIMMTTMAALMGTLPIALGLGAGGEARRPLGLAVVGGLILSQLLTLFITPVVYTYMESLQGWLRSVYGSRRAEDHKVVGLVPAASASRVKGMDGARGGER
ncbi:MAG: efflux RND transporter permease subunit [Syntrophobacteraceae bacterium]